MTPVQPIDQEPRVRVVPTSYDSLRGNVYRDDQWIGFLSIREQPDGRARFYPHAPDPLHPRAPMAPTRWYATMTEALVYLLRPERAKPGHYVPDVEEVAYSQASGTPARLDDILVAAYHTRAEDAIARTS